MKALYFCFFACAAAYFALFVLTLIDGDYVHANCFAGGCAVSGILGFYYKSSAAADENK